MVNPWFKFYGSEYLLDTKIMQLDGDERSCWLTILCLASQNKDGVIRFFSESQLLTMSGVSRKIAILEKLQKLGMIDLGNGDVTVNNWIKRQYSESVQRVRDYRLKQKGSADSNGHVTTEENREDKKRIDKSIYGELQKVKLTTEEYGKLVEKLGEKNTQILIDELDTYIASTGKRYSSHYATLLNWARRKIQEKRSNPKAKQFVI